MPIELTSKLSKVKDTMTTEVDNDLIILNMSTNHYVALDPIGRRIWELLENPMQVGALCQQLATEYAGPQEQISADVINFLTQLNDENLVSILADSAG